MKNKPGLKVLIIEADQANRLQMEKLLPEQFRKDFSDSGKEAVLTALNAAIRFEPYDLIIMDIATPEMEGRETLRKIRENEESLGFRYPGGSKIIITTGSIARQDIKNAFYFLGDAYLVKPILKSRLLDELRKLNLSF